MTMKKFLKLFESDQVVEKAPPGAKAERMVKHIKKGYAKDGKLTPKEKSIAFATAWKAHNAGKLDEGLNVMLDEEGHTLEHIVNRFKHEAKIFMNTGEMSENLYDALYDYYVDRGEMPYGVAKAREGDPYTWVAARFEADIDGTVDVKVPMGEVAGDPTLNELARLAGLTEVDVQPKEKSWSQSFKDVADTYKTGLGMTPDRLTPVDPNKPLGPKKDQVKECDDNMPMDQKDSINVSTNMSSDGTKSVNISAQGDKADALLQMLKMAGMRPHDDHDHEAMSEPAVVMISSDEEMMDEERETKYSNTPEEEYQTVASITRQGNDLNREKKQFANMPKAGDNPMATDQMLDEELSALLDSILVKEVDPRRPKGDTGIADIYTADKGIQPPSPDEGPVGKSPIAPKAPATPKAPVVTPGLKR